MCRYDNLELDDSQQADDSPTRLVSGVFFLIGLQLQFLVIFHMMIKSVQERERRRELVSHLGNFQLVPPSSAQGFGRVNVQEEEGRHGDDEFR